MKRFILIVLLASFTLATQAQTNVVQDPPRRNLNRVDFQRKLETHRVAYINTRLDLTEAEANAFWPLYTKYVSELEAIRLNNCLYPDEMPQGVRMGDRVGSMSDKEAGAVLDAHLKMEADILALKDRYFKEFEKVLPVQKVATLYFVEREFMSRLMRRGPNSNIDRPRNNWPQGRGRRR